MPDDPIFDSMDPLLRLYMFEHFCFDQEREYELAKSQAILIGSFHNPEAAQQMLKADDPKYQSTDEDFEKSLQMVVEDKIKHEMAQTAQPKRRRRRKVKANG